MHEKVEQFVLHYSDMYDKEVSKMIITEIVPSEEDAKRLLSFIDILFKQSSLDAEQGKFIYGEREDNYAVEKGVLAIFGILKANDYASLVDNWN